MNKEDKPMTDLTIPVYELSLNVRVAWQAHSLSNAGNNGSNRTMPRRQLLANGIETDACSGNIAKRYHVALLTEQMMSRNIHLCTACAVGDGRRASVNPVNDMATILQCGMCDTHGFLVTGKKGGEEGEIRQRLSKHSLVEFTMALALPESAAESVQLFTRQAARNEGESSEENGQMLFKKSVRSGEYAQCVRYKAAGVGVDTEIWQVVILDEQERLKRHQAILTTLQDQVQSPSGAMTATLLPHLTGIQGVVAIKTTAGRAPLYSPLAQDFMTHLEQLAMETCLIFPFHNLTEFHLIFQRLLAESFPVQPVLEQKLVAEVVR
jgi:CRISPR-associated protein Cst2